MKRLLSALAAAGVLLVTTASAAPAAPVDGGRLPVRPAPATQVWATRALSSQPGQQSQVWLRLDVEEMTPRVVTADGPDSITISGKVVNVGDRALEDIELRLERGQPLTSEEQVRKALREPTDAEVVQPNFTPVTDRLEQNESKPFRLTVPLRGTDPTSLRITEPGIYPILANINGVPDYGGRARLAALSTLLPVLAMPGGQAPTPPANPAKLTLLWPLADRPRLVNENPPVLADDELAGSLAMGGRLYGLLMAYESALTSPLGTGVCLAVDPDLLRTVEAMSQGYEVSGQGAGKGKSAAGMWRDRLRLLAAGRCVIALPDADADLVALSRAELTGLLDLSLAGAEVVRRVLGVQPTSGLVWPEDGVLDQPTLANLTARGVTSLVLDQSAVAGTPGTGPVRFDVAEGKPVTAVRVDGMVSDALQGAATTRPVAGVTTPSETRPVSVQNALAALTFRAGFQSTGQHVVVTPPRRWNAPTGEVDLLLRTAKSLVGGGFATPVALESLLASPPEQTAALSYPVDAGAREVPPTVTASVAESWSRLHQLAESMSQPDAESAEPADLVDPLRLALLRAVSGAWRGNEDGARAALAVGRTQLDGLRDQVTVTEPNSPILLGSGDSPIPLSIKNRLDVRVTVRIVIEDTPGIVAKDLTDIELPARGDRLVRVPVEVQRSGRFPVHVRLVTTSGVELGERARLEVSSSAYGTITVVITGLAGAALVLLSARRIYRRVRAARAASAQVPNDASEVTPERSSTS
ncbi:hypothetical protein FHX81_4366 [Saccharothrix saharensis]|uniref:Glycoprotein n=1 Tax=Saccharothrix saharensis TaxID=571190 RepID=A0A543JGK6_9PSEU|nr:DUF6049 family protein [Saccharothrix saharensis]TQM81975.1 hypothetical protein FHX81_4366 [Saccharothrix saharensis]